MPAQQAFAAMVSEYVAPALVAEGFERTDDLFHRAVDRNWEVIHLSRGKLSGVDHLRFSATLAVGIDRLRGRGYDWPKGARPSELDCHFTAQIGQLLTGGNVWWDVRPETDLADLAETLLEAIFRYGLPWLEARSTDEGLRNTCLADLASLPWWELRPLRELVRQLGPEEARHALAAELRRRADSDGPALQ
jgi:hypothetical protein